MYASEIVVLMHIYYFYNGKTKSSLYTARSYRRIPLGPVTDGRNVAVADFTEAGGEARGIAVGRLYGRTDSLEVLVLLPLLLLLLLLLLGNIVLYGIQYAHI